MDKNTENLTILAIEILYNASKAFVMDDQEYVPCNMCLSHDGKLILSCSKQEPINGVLILLKGEQYDLQIIGDSVPVDAQSPYMDRYKKYFPDAVNITELVEITPVKYIMRDKSDNEISIDNLNIINTFSGEVEDRMTEHMNEDHVDAMRDYCNLASIEITDQGPLMLGVDPHGFDLLVNNQLRRFQFNNKCETPKQVREALVDLAKRART